MHVPFTRWWNRVFKTTAAVAATAAALRAVARCYTEFVLQGRDDFSSSNDWRRRPRRRWWSLTDARRNIVNTKQRPNRRTPLDRGRLKLACKRRRRRRRRRRWTCCERLMRPLFGSDGHAGRSVGRSCVERARARAYTAVLDRGARVFGLRRTVTVTDWCCADGEDRKTVGRAEGLSASFTGTPTRNVRVTRRAYVETGFVFVRFRTGFVVSTDSLRRCTRVMPSPLPHVRPPPLSCPWREVERLSCVRQRRSEKKGRDGSRLVPSVGRSACV